jgi:hypothetical protein
MPFICPSKVDNDNDNAKLGAKSAVITVVAPLKIINIIHQ